jgi:hypothetical protein
MLVCLVQSILYGQDGVLQPFQQVVEVLQWQADEQQDADHADVSGVGWGAALFSTVSSGISRMTSSVNIDRKIETEGHAQAASSNVFYDQGESSMKFIYAHTHVVFFLNLLYELTIALTI